MVAVKTGFTPPPMPGMPSPMQPMGGLPPMPPMGGPGTFPVPQGGNPFAPLPPMPLAGMPPPMGGPGTFPVAPNTQVPQQQQQQQGSNAPRRKRFGDSLESMLGRNMFAPQQQMVAPGMPMMRTPTPRPMEMGGIVQGFANGGNANAQAAASMMSAGIGNIGGKAITSGAQNIQSSFTSSASKRRRKKRRQEEARLAAEKAAAIQQIRDAEAAAAVAAQQTPSGKMDFGDEDYTPTSAALNQQLSGLGATNITTNFSPVDYTTTGSNNNFTTAAQADTGVSGAEFVAAGGLGSVDSGSPTSPPPVTLGSTEALPAPVENPPLVVYTDMVGNTHNSAAERDIANLGIQQQMYGSGNQAAKNVQQELYKQYAEQFPEGKRMEGDSEELGRMAADTYLQYAPQINELLGPQGLPNQPFNLPFSFSGIESIKPSGSEDSPSNMTDKQLGYFAERYPEGFLNGRRLRETSGLDNMGLPSEQDVGLGLGSDYPDMSMTAIPGATTPDDIQLESGPALSLVKPGNRGFTPEGTQIAPEAATVTPTENFESTASQMQANIFDPSGGETDEGQKIAPPKAGTGGSDKSKATPTEMITSYTNKETGKTTVDDPDTSENEAMLAQLGLLSTLRENQANPNVSRDPTSVNAAEAAYLQEALGNMDDPNFAEQVINKVIRNLTFGMFDPDDPQKREDAKAILDAYRDTGKFVYDTEENAIDLSTEEGLKQLEALTKGAGIEPAVTGVRDKEGNVVDFEDGTGFRNIMGDYNPVYKDGQVFSGGSDTQNILTGSTDVFGGNTNTGNTATEITTGGGDDDGGSDTGTDTGVDTGHTVDENGNKVCNQEGYIYNPETKICEPKKEEEEVDGTPGSGIGTGTSGESFDDVLKRVVMAAPDVAPISANVQPMQEGGMAGLNRAADNFLQALAG